MLVHCGFLRQAGWQVSQAAMEAEGVVVAPASLDEDLGFPESVEDLSVQELGLR